MVAPGTALATVSQAVKEEYGEREGGGGGGVSGTVRRRGESSIVERREEGRVEVRCNITLCS